VCGKRSSTVDGWNGGGSLLVAHGGVSSVIKTRDSCSICYEPIARISTVTALPFCLLQFRAHLYDAVFDIAKSMRVPTVSPSQNTTNGIFNEMDTLVARQSFQIILNGITKYTQSASLRLCSVMMAEYLGIDRGYVVLLHSLLKFYLRNLDLQKCTPNTAVTVNGVLNAYCEIVAECTAFDQSDVCWNGIRPLLITAFEMHSIMKHDSSTEPPAVEVNYPEEERHPSDASITKICRTRFHNLTKHPDALKDTVHTLLRCVGFLLVRRKSVLFHERIPAPTPSSLGDYLVRSSAIFPDRRTWTHRTTTESERTRLVLTLQSIGVLSFVDDECSDDDGGGGIGVGSTPSGAERSAPRSAVNDRDEWPFPAVSSMRAALGRIGPGVRCPPLFTTTTSADADDDDDFGAPRREGTTKRARRSRADSAMAGEPLMDYIDTDPLRIIFSFFGYKRLVRMTSVCKKWNAVGNEDRFWRSFYTGRFKAVFPEDHALVEPSLRGSFVRRYCVRNWRRMFDRRWAKERAVRGKFGGGGGDLLKRRVVCDVVGCVVACSIGFRTVLHKKSHGDDIEKKIGVLKRAALREKKKADTALMKGSR